MFPSKEWTPDERLKIIAAWSAHTFTLVDGAKFYASGAAMQDLQTIHILATTPAYFLEYNRQGLQPYIDLVVDHD